MQYTSERWKELTPRRECALHFSLWYPSSGRDDERDYTEHKNHRCYKYKYVTYKFYLCFVKVFRAWCSICRFNQKHVFRRQQCGWVYFFTFICCGNVAGKYPNHYTSAVVKLGKRICRERESPSRLYRRNHVPSHRCVASRVSLNSNRKFRHTVSWNAIFIPASTVTVHQSDL